MGSKTLPGIEVYQNDRCTKPFEYLSVILSAESGSYGSMFRFRQVLSHFCSHSVVHQSATSPFCCAAPSSAYSIPPPPLALDPSLESESSSILATLRAATLTTNYEPRSHGRTATRIYMELSLNAQQDRPRHANDHGGRPPPRTRTPASPFRAGFSLLENDSSEPLQRAFLGTAILQTNGWKAKRQEHVEA